MLTADGLSPLKDSLGGGKDEKKYWKLRTCTLFVIAFLSGTVPGLAHLLREPWSQVIKPHRHIMWVNSLGLMIVEGTRGLRIERDMERSW